MLCSIYLTKQKKKMVRKCIHIIKKNEKVLSNLHICNSENIVLKYLHSLNYDLFMDMYVLTYKFILTYFNNVHFENI